MGVIFAISIGSLDRKRSTEAFGEIVDFGFSSHWQKNFLRAIQIEFGNTRWNRRRNCFDQLFTRWRLGPNSEVHAGRRNCIDIVGSDFVARMVFVGKKHGDFPLSVHIE